MVLLLNFWAAVLVTLALAALVLQLLGTMALLGIKLSAVPAVLLVLAIGRGVHFTVHLCLVSKIFVFGFIVKFIRINLYCMYGQGTPWPYMQ